MKKSDRVLRLIALFKLLKATLLLIVGVGAFDAAPPRPSRTIQNWVQLLRLDPHARYIDMAVVKASGIAPNKIKEVGVGSMVYAGIFLAEGIGLWFQKRWAEWLTIVITSL